MPNVVRAEELEPVDFELALPGEHNRRNAAAALAALELAGVDRAPKPSARIAEFAGAARRFELRGEAGGVRVYDDYAHHPAEVAADARRGARARRAARARPLPAAPLLADAAPRARVRARARRRRRRCRHRRLRGARAADRRRDRQAVVDALASSGRDARRVDALARATAPRWLARWARQGDVVLTLGAGDVDRAAPLLLERALVIVEEDVPLARYTTLGTGGRRGGSRGPEPVDELHEALALGGSATTSAWPSVGLGSNLLVADEGVDALVLKLGGELAAVEVDGRLRRRGRRRGERGRASTARATRASAASSSRARSRARPAAASG